MSGTCPIFGEQARPEVQEPLWLIMSGAYIGQELAAELGSIPPSMIPIGHARLYELQLASIPDDARDIFIVLPDSFPLPTEDKQRLDGRDVTVVPVPDGLTLGNCIVYALNYIGAAGRALRLLHGDTLIRQLPDGSDLIGVAPATTEYGWAYVATEEGRVTHVHTDVAAADSAHHPAVCGVFYFSSSSELVRALIRAQGDFLKGLTGYAERRTVQARPISEWRDFGHLQTFFQSRRAESTARAFNDISIGREVVRKSSRHNGAKIKAEAAWFSAVPPSIQVYCSRLLSSGDTEQGPFYDTEYEYMLTLAELYMFGAIGRTAWNQIIAACADFLAACAAVKAERSGDDLLETLTVGKTRQRLERYARETGFDIDRGTRLDGRPLPSLLAIAEELEGRIDFASGRRASLMHGDFCFSNIFYNSRARRVRVIDPRGFITEAEPTPFGDTRYDLAKLSHSVVGRYDRILAGRYRCHGSPHGGIVLEFEEDPASRWLEGAFGAMTVDGVGLSSVETHAIMTGLFLSMLPLHADRPDRQTAFVANALRLYAQHA